MKNVIEFKVRFHFYDGLNKKGSKYASENTKLEELGLVSALNYQKDLTKGGVKGDYGLIYSFQNETIGKATKEYSPSGLLFIDLDHLKNDKADEIFYNFEKIFGGDESVITEYFSASHNLHFISYSDKINTFEDYKRECKKAYASICSDLLKYYGTDYEGLLNIIWNGEGDKYKEVFDVHNIKNPKQGLYLFPSDYKLRGGNIESVDIDESIYDDFVGWEEESPIKVQAKTSGARVQGNVSQGNSGINQNIIQNQKTNILYKWRDLNNFPVFYREEGKREYIFNNNSFAPDDFRYKYIINTLANIEGTDFDLVRDILPDEQNIGELFSQWNYGVDKGLPVNEVLRYLLYNKYIELISPKEVEELYNYETELKPSVDWEIIEDGKYLTNYKDKILKELGQNQTLFIESGCGTGKTTLIKEILKEAKSQGKNILGFCHLNSILSQSYRDFVLADEDKECFYGQDCYFTNLDYIKNCWFYINEYKILNNIKKSGGYIIIDEIHSLYLGASYRNIMGDFLAFLERAKNLGINIMAFTGTPLKDFGNIFNNTLKFCRKTVEEKDRYEINIFEGGKGNYTDIIDYVLNHQEEDSKFIIFNNKNGKDIGKGFKNNGFFGFDDIRRDKRNFYDLTLRDNSTNILLNTGKLPEDINVFVATDYIKEGVNIEDLAEEDKIIFLTDVSNICDVISLIQLGGRTRKQKSVINMFVKDSDDFDTSRNTEEYVRTRFNIGKSVKLNSDYLTFVNSFKSLEDWINYIKDHRLPVVINKINNISLGKEERFNNKLIKLNNMDKIMKMKQVDASKKLFKVCSVGAKESINDDFQNDGFYIEPVESDYYENKIYFPTKRSGRAVLKLLNISSSSKILGENENEGISLEKLDLIYNIYYLAEDLYNWTDVDFLKGENIQEQKKWTEERYKRRLFLYALMTPYEPSYKSVFTFMGPFCDITDFYNTELLEYTEVEIYNSNGGKINDPDLVDKIIKTHKYFSLFQKFPRTLGILLESFWKNKIKENWEKIEDIFLEEYNNKKQSLSDKRAKNGAKKAKQVIFVIEGVEKTYNSKKEVDEDFKYLGFTKREIENISLKALYNLKENEVLKEKIKRVGDKFVIL